MPEFRERVKKPFAMLFTQSHSQLNATAETLESHQPMVKKWEEPKQNIRYRVVPQFKRWTKALERIRSPLYNQKAFNREKNRLRRAGYFSRFHWRVLVVRFQMLLMGTAFIIKIPLIAVFALLKNMMAIPMALFYILKRILVTVLCIGIVVLFFYFLYKFVMFI
jgi:hypothetical protein